MRVVRNNVFETNSSSTHSIAISKDKIKDVSGSKIYFGSGEYGWEYDCVTDTASYLHTALVAMCSPTEYQYYIDRIKTILDKYNVQYEFAPVKFEKSEYSEYEYVKFKSDEWAGIDHSEECKEIVESILSDEDLFLRYLFGDSCIYTGNDNSDDKDNMCYCAEEEVWDLEKMGFMPNPNHDSKHYDYFFKGN